MLEASLAVGAAALAGLGARMIWNTWWPLGGLLAAAASWGIWRVLAPRRAREDDPVK